MKLKLTMIYLLFLFLLNCSNTNTKQVKILKYGDKFIDNQNIKSFYEVANELRTKSSTTVKISGIIGDYDNSKGFWLNPFKKGAEPIFVAFDCIKVDMPENLSGKTAIVEGFASKIIEADYKHMVKAGQHINYVVLCNKTNSPKDENENQNCIKTKECCSSGRNIGIEFKRNDLGQLMQHTKIEASGLLVMGYQ